MKIKPGFKLRTVMGNAVIVAEGADQMDFNKIISMNESAALIWQAVQNKDFTAEDMADALLANYEIDRATALADAIEMAKQWIEVGLVAE